MNRTIVKSTGSRPITFNGFLINPGEEKELPCGISIPEEYKGHVSILRIEKEEKLIINERPIVLKEEQEKTLYEDEGIPKYKTRRNK